MESSARFVVAPLLRHLAAAEFSENRDRLFADTVDPIDTHAVVGVGVFRDLELIGRSVVVIQCFSMAKWISQTQLERAQARAKASCLRGLPASPRQLRRTLRKAINGSGDFGLFCGIFRTPRSAPPC